MPFREAVKLRVKKRAAFRCCRCGEIGIEVHHIVPEAEGGPSTEENGAPLCPNCHSWFGANPEKRKEIGQMRDWWYETCESKYGGPDLSRLDELMAELRRQSANAAEQQRVIGQIHSQLKRLVDEAGLGESDPAKAMASKVNAVVTATTLAQGIHANFRCRRCGTFIGLLMGSDACPDCGEPI